MLLKSESDSEYSGKSHRFYSQYKKKRKLLNGHFLGVKFIDCKNDSISVALPFNKELYSEVLS